MNGFAGKRLELGWGLEKFLLRRIWIDSFGRVGGVLFRQHLRRFRYFLLGGHVRRIDALGLFELGQSHFEVPLLQELFALLQVEIAVHGVHPEGAKLVLGIPRVGPKRAVVFHERGVIILYGLGLTAGVKFLICFGTAA